VESTKLSENVGRRPTRDTSESQRRRRWKSSKRWLGKNIVTMEKSCLVCRSGPPRSQRSQRVYGQKLRHWNSFKNERVPWTRAPYLGTTTEILTRPYNAVLKSPSGLPILGYQISESGMDANEKYGKYRGWAFPRWGDGIISAATSSAAVTRRIQLRLRWGTISAWSIMSR
jgi:hypothetical protein